MIYVVSIEIDIAYVGTFMHVRGVYSSLTKARQAIFKEVEKEKVIYPNKGYHFIDTSYIVQQYKINSDECSCEYYFDCEGRSGEELEDTQVVVD
jgi:hypothetical protein